MLRFVKFLVCADSRQVVQQLHCAGDARFEDADDGFVRATLERAYQWVWAEAGHQKGVVVP